MSYRHSWAWPPTWIWTGGEIKKRVRGEVGILRQVFQSSVSSKELIFLIIEHEGNEYMGCLMISDRAFRRQIFELLQTKVGCTIEHIGGLDLSHLL